MTIPSPDPLGASGLALALVAKATLVLGASAVLDRVVLRRAPAAARHLVWCFTVGALLLLPALSALVPAWEVTLGRVAAGVQTRPYAPAAERTPGPGVAAPAPRAVPAAARRARPPAAPPETRAAVAGPHRSPAPPAGGGGWVLAVWLAGAAVVLARLLLGHFGAWRLGRQAEPVTDPAARWLAAEAASDLGLMRPVAMVRSPAAAMPMTWGLLRPTILLPAGAEGWPPERHRAVLLHELAHVKRLDCLSQSLAALCCALYWFHPGAWWAARRMREERERACDDTVLDLGVRASDYASHLLEIARSYRGYPLAAAAAVAMARPSQLEGRVLAVLDSARGRGAPGRRRVLAAGALALLALLPLSALRPAAASQAQVATPAPTAAPDAWPAPQGQPRLPAPVVATRGGPDPVAEVEEAPPGILGGLMNVVGSSVRGALDGLDGEVTPPELDPDGSAAADGLLGLVESTVRTTLGALEGGARASAPGAVAGLQDPRAVQALIAALRDEDAEVRRSAAWALGEIADTVAVQPLIAVLRDEDAEVRSAAAHALGQIEDPAALDALAEAVGDPEPEVRAMALWALSELDDERALPALVAALADPDAESRAMAAHALGELAPPNAPAALIDLLRDADAEVRTMAAWALAEIADPASVPALRAALADGNAEVRATALHALAEMDDEAAVEAIVDALQDPDPEVRRHAARALAEIL